LNAGFGFHFLFFAGAAGGLGGGFILSAAAGCEV
jgi:hypothetical protein